MSPRPGDYGCVNDQPRGIGVIFGDAIRLVTRSRFSHAFVVLEDGHSIVEATPRGARIADLKEYDGAEIAFNDEEPKSDGQRQMICAFARDLVGTPYNFMDIFALFLASFGMRPQWVERRVQREDRLICSQLVDRAYMLSSVHLFGDHRLPQDVTPGDLADRITTRAWERPGGVFHLEP